ncbi:MAG: 1-acyl-sn-glycerol-3-phosphate acyltransferase [Flavobacteriaceae bacterium]|jgi:1-acyl-sn-glycerol-3-phosphate acyltransferase|tara:strand:+ start:12537 stop:13286 length:750 start_codon:yes stop_codon:yes gene_type:complete
MKVLLKYFISGLHFICFGFLLSFFHVIQWVGFYIIGNGVQKGAVDVLNFFLIKCLLIVGAKITFDNPFILPKNRSIIFVANHQSTYDIPPIIWHFRKHHPKFISKKKLGKGIPSISFNLRHGGSLLIDRENQRKALEDIQKFAKGLAQKNHSAVIFPEGTRSRDGIVKPFHKSGLLSLMKHMPDALIVPISIGNSWRFAFRNYFPMPLGVHLKVTVHAPIEITDGEHESLFYIIEKKIVDEVNRLQKKM